MLYKDLISPSEVVVDKAAIDGSLTNIIETFKGSLPGKPDFGANLGRYLFEFLDDIFIEQIKSDLKRNLLAEPRISVENIEITPIYAQHVLTIKIDYVFTFVKTDTMSFETTIQLD